MGDYHIKAGKILEGFNFLDESFKINKEKPLYESKLLYSFCKEDLDLDNYYNDIAESIIFEELKQYKPKANREFIIHDKEEIVKTIKNTIILLNKYHENPKDIDNIKKIIINVPILLINLILSQKTLDYIFNLFNKCINHKLYECKSIIDRLYNSIKDIKLFNRTIKLYKINLITYKQHIDYEKLFIEYLKNNIKILVIDKNVIDSYKNNNLTNYLINNYYTNPDKWLEYFITNNIENFSINIDAIAKWFDMRKDTIKDTLKESYKKNIDYKVTKDEPTGKKGKPSETILLTPKCFKLMAMQSKNKKAVQVREYYYELEQVLDQYKEYIIKGLEEKIKTLENNQKPKINPKKGIIYVIATADGIGHYKVGKTVNLRKRLTNYNGDKKDDIIPIYIYESDDIDRIEGCIKSYAKEYQYRKYKEVYKIDINLLKELINN
jgi:phage anti-repressor protein